MSNPSCLDIPLIPQHPGKSSQASNEANAALVMRFHIVGSICTTLPFGFPSNDLFFYSKLCYKVNSHVNLQNAREEILSKDGAKHSLRRTAPVPELLYFFICNVPE